MPASALDTEVEPKLFLIKVCNIIKLHSHYYTHDYSISIPLTKAVLRYSIKERNKQSMLQMQ